MKGHILIQLSADVTVSIPAEWSYKHFTEDEVDASCSELADKLGGLFLYKEESE